MADEYKGLYVKGSSPRMRGAPIGVSLRHLGNGIIPAYAGSTRGELAENADCRDHPRVCGEHAARIVDALQRPGSSPRMRGALAPRVPDSVLARIIPAYAGSTAVHVSGGREPQDHPRVCGEHPLWAYSLRPPAGSSPRMRGAHVRDFALGGGHGIIPAYAGSTQPPCF